MYWRQECLVTVGVHVHVTLDRVEEFPWVPTPHNRALGVQPLGHGRVPLPPS